MTDGGDFRPAQVDGYAPIDRPEVLAHVPTAARSFLDIGCAGGGFGAQVRREFGLDVRIVGVEAVATEAEVARSAGFDEVFTGYFPEALTTDETFDVITFNDVLEHIYDPWAALNECHAYLSASGVVIAAIPSIQFAPVVKQLIRGRWDYSGGGTLDWTHIRFFTRATMIEMFEKCGFEVQACVGANSMFDSGRYAKLRPLRRLLGASQFMHFVLVARSTGAPRRA